MSDDEYEIPLLDQRYFGSGLKRKRIHFVPSTIAQSNEKTLSDKASAADTYLSIVLGRTEAPDEQESKHEEQHEPYQASEEHDKVTSAICEICRKPLAEDSKLDHPSSIVHQICLQHSHPPSHVDRERKGLAVLQSQGWDPDSRLGLGKIGEGRLYPVKATERLARTGLGARFRDIQSQKRPVKLDAGKVRHAEMQAAKQREILRNAFYRNEDLDHYLGEETHEVSPPRLAKRKQ